MEESLPNHTDTGFDATSNAMSIALALVSILLSSIILSIFFVRRNKPGHLLYPGPKGLPLLGNVHQIEEKQWIRYTNWHREFGPIYSLNWLGQPVLVVGNAKIAADLMDRRSVIYSDRPRFIMATEILTGGMNIAFARWGDRWKRMRRAANTGLSAKAVEQYAPLQEKEVTYFLHGLLHKKGNVDPHIRRTSAAAVLSAVYAYPSISLNDPLVQRIENYVERMLKAALPGNYMVDLVPGLMYLPTWVAKWKKEGYAWFRKDTQLFVKLMEDVKHGRQDGTRLECFASTLLDGSSNDRLDPVERAWLAGMMFGAGTEAVGDLLAATLSFFVLAMVLHPEVQAKLHAEITSIIGTGRLPTFKDIRVMPYLTAVIKETMRWRPMGPLGVPHRAVHDDLYDGHFISAGTIILPNVWAMNHDETLFTDAEKFIPERHLKEDNTSPRLYPDTKEFGHHTFGFGRRSCPGYAVASNALAISAAGLVWAFKISGGRDTSGRDVTPDPDALLDEGLAVRPIPFDCELKPRSSAVVETIETARAQV